MNTQAEAIPKEGGISAAPILPARFGIPRVLELTVPASDKVKLSDAVDYPVGSVPTIVQWTLMNDSAAVLRIGGVEVDTGRGLIIPAGSAADPTFFSGQTDPGETWVFNTSTGDVVLQVMFVGNLPSVT